jgi:hypothetical protein
MNFKLLFISFLSFGFLFSCNVQKGPDASLKSFINYRFSASQDKDGTLAYTTGVLSDRINAMTDEEYSEYKNNSEYSKRKYRVNLSKCTENQCFITYTLSIIKKGDSGPSAIVDIKKIAELKKVEEKWKVADVNNVKTYIESKQPIDVTPN